MPQITDMSETVNLIRKMRSNGNRLRKQRHLADIILICSDQRFACHRLVLVSCSHFFENVLQPESSSNRLVNLEMDDVSPDILEILLDYMYEGHILTPMSDARMVLAAMTASFQLEIWGAAVHILSVWLHERPMINFMSFWDWSEVHGDDQVKTKIISHLAINFSKNCNSLEFLRLNFNRLQALLNNKFISQYKCHDLVLHSILKWAQHNMKSREQYLRPLLIHVDNDKVSVNLKKELLHDTTWHRIPKMLQSVPIKPLKMPPNQMTSKSESVITPRHQLEELSPPRFCASVMIPPIAANKPKSNSTTSIKQAGTISIMIKRDNCQQASPTNKCMKPSVLSPSNKCKIGLSSFTDSIRGHSGPALLVAGRGDSNQLLAFVYIPETNTWSLPVEISTPPLLHRGCVCFNGSLYLVGGEDVHEKKLESFYIYDLQSCTLTQGPGLRVARSCMGVDQWRGLIFAVGGLNRFGRPMTHVEVYNPEAKRWTLMPPLRFKRYKCGTTIVNNHLFMIGGNAAKCESYDLQNDLGWHEVASLPPILADTNIYCASNDHQIFAIRDYRPDKVCVLDIQQNQWHVLRTTGSPPDEVVGAFGYAEDIYCVSKAGKLHVLDVGMLSWKKSVAIPRACAYPLHLSYINLDDFK